MLSGRLLAILLCATGLLLAQPSVTTIQDTIYKADGSRFTGTAVINWTTFESGDTSNIGMQTLSVPIINGSLYVQLVPNTNARPSNVYTVHYNSDGVEQFTESWSVPPSTNNLRVRDVRVDPNAATGTGASTGPASIAETQVDGLSADLVIRPTKGSGFSPGRSAVINAAGEIESVAGNPTDCVRVNGTAGACFDTSVLASFVDGEVPLGVINGVNVSFSLANPPMPSSALQIYRNGMYQSSGIDFTISGNNISFVTGAVPQPGDLLLASYRMGGLQATNSPQLITTFPLIGAGPLSNNLTLALADSAFLRRGHRSMLLGDSFAGSGASIWAVPHTWFAQAALASRSAIRYTGNSGSTGDTVATTLAGLIVNVISRNPDKVFIAAGSADLAAGTAPSVITAGVSSIVKALKSANILPILCSVPPVPQFLAASSQYNLQLRHLADAEGLVFIDFSPTLVDPATGLLRTAFGANGSNLTGTVNRLLASVAASATTLLFDPTPPWTALSSPDGVNLIADPLFLNAPSRWVQVTGTGSIALSLSIGSDPILTGNAAILNKSDRGSVNLLNGPAITSGFQPGDRVAFTGRIKTANVEIGSMPVDVGLQFSPGIGVFYPLFHWVVDIGNGQWYAETVVPPGITSITPFIQLNQGTGLVTVGQIGLINLTALGL